MLQITPMPDSAVLLDVLVSVNRLHSTLQQRVTEMLGSTGLSLSQWLLLCHLRHAAAGTLTEIAATLHRDIGGLRECMGFQCATTAPPPVPLTGLASQMSGTITTKITPEIQKMSFSPSMEACASRPRSK